VPPPPPPPPADSPQLDDLEPIDPTARCALQPSTGPCGSISFRWYFDSEQRRCRRFTYGGCGGNDNSFPDAVACMRACPAA
jgi:hypothetical protein